MNHPKVHVFGRPQEEVFVSQRPEQCSVLKKQSQVVAICESSEKVTHFQILNLSHVYVRKSVFITVNW